MKTMNGKIFYQDNQIIKKKNFIIYIFIYE